MTRLATTVLALVGLMLPTYGLQASAAPAPAQALVQRDTTYGCITCHADLRTAFFTGVHAERDIRCHDCHGGDPAAVELPEAHRGRYVGAPSKVATVALCGSCHSDPNQMRQYGLPVGQVAEFRTSRHGRLLLGNGDLNAPTCTDCHDAHRILRPDDARSSVHPTNIVATCARCHENETMMARYDIASDQTARFRRSAHGVGLYERQNFAAPSCIGCHGSHSALPPRVTEISNVCARCHQLVGRALAAGPHGRVAQTARLGGCLACHANHDTERVPADRIAAACAECHDPGTKAHDLGVTIERDVVQATADLQAAEHAVERLTRAGQHTSDAWFRYQTALTAYLQIAEIQHSLDVDRLEELNRRVRSVSRTLRGSAEVAEERRWEHKLLMIPVWFVVLSCVALATLWLRAHERSEGS